MAKMMRKLVGLVVLIMWLSRPVWCQGHPTNVLTIVGTQTGSDNGTITISVNGQTQTIAYGQFSTAAAIASSFGAHFSQYPNPTAPPLCTAGICAKSDGSRIVFQFDNTLPSQTMTWTASAGSPFSVDTSLWPQSGAQAPLTMTLNCIPFPVIVGDTISCMAGLPIGTTGSVSFSVDGSSWETSVPIDANGNAMVMGGLSGASVGEHLITAQYLSATAVASNAYEPVDVIANPGAASVVYNYAIEDHNGQSGYAANGGVIAYSDSVNGTWVLGYDSLNRLVSSAQGPNGSSSTQYGCWAYDSFGNRTTQATANLPLTANCQPSFGTTSYLSSLAQYGDGTNRVTARASQNLAGTSPVATPVYDDGDNTAGNITQDLASQYTYDAQGHICASHTASGMIGYLYDAAGHRVAKGTITAMFCDPSRNGFAATNVYILGADGETMTEMSGGSWTRTHIVADGQQIASYDLYGIHFHIYDWLGTRRVQTDFAGVPEDSCQSQPFGDGLTCSNDALDASDDHLTGKERDAESGLDYFGARYYGSNMGRMMSPDWAAKAMPVPYARLDDPQSLNLYAYVGNNPLGRTDPTGHYDDKCAGGDKKCEKGVDNFDKQRSKDLQSKDGRVRAAAAAWGTRGDHNGIGVKFVTQKQIDADAPSANGSTAAEVTSHIAAGKLTVDAEFSENLSGSDLGQAIAHEGSHIEDAAHFANSYDAASGTYSSGSNYFRRDTEFQAYATGSIVKPYAFIYPNGPIGPNGYQQLDNFITRHYPFADTLRWDPTIYPQR